MSVDVETPLGRLTPRHLLWVAIVVGAALVPMFADPFGLFLGATILALGLYGAAFDLLYGYTGLLSFGHSVFFGVGAYAATFAINDYGMGAFLALLIAFLVTGVVAIGLGLIAVRVSSHGFVIVTILIALIAHLAAASLTDITGGTDGLTVVVPQITLPGLGSYSLVEPVFRYYFVLALLLVSLAVMYRLVTSPVGLAFRMIRENETRAQMLGYNVTVYKLGAFMASGAFAGLAGALSMFITGFVSASDFSLIVSGDAIIFTLVGGRGTLFGAVLGAALIELTANQVSELTDAYPLFIGVLLVATAVLEPQGLLGLWTRLKDRLLGSGGGGVADEDVAGREVAGDE
ncbi:branched-chain amino acid ABC transporter permease [Salinigranum salinum]|uniref:branched-chain amino acid ABC transporter permease n=1 Tax=Salinigranum salinum TaxID=1364937 RepID=UPI0012609B47|nr:branched-chain amino acid ABC transporter permease [Salinigranum salinum]